MSSILHEPPVRTQRPTRTRKPPVRTLRIEADPFGGGFVRITQDGTPVTYRTKEVPVDPEFGAFGFLFQKVDEAHTPTADPYYLCSSSRDPAQAVITCDCFGFIRWQKCKHTAALRVLMARRVK